MTSSGMLLKASLSAIMSAVLTFILAGAILVPLPLHSTLSQRHSGLPRPVPLGQDRDGWRLALRGPIGSGGRDGTTYGPARWLDLVRRRACSLARCEAACADARPALRELRVRRRARLWRRNLQVARAYRAVDQFGQDARFHDPVL